MNLLLTQGNAVQIPLADESVHCVVTSPPYWGLRDYGIGGQLGLEPTPEQYIENMVAVFREVKRVLRADGTLWLNMGDSYHNVRTHNKGGVPTNTVHVGGSRDGTEGFSRENRNKKLQGLKEKDLCGIPWRVAFALQADGWWLRSDIIWSKPNPMPESVTDRPTKAHEYVFLMTKSARYYYDADAVREPHTAGNLQRQNTQPKKDDGEARIFKFAVKQRYLHPSGRNRRTVWHIATAPYSGAHFATYPPALVEPCIKAGTSEHGVCPECGSPWERVVEKERFNASWQADKEVITGKWDGVGNQTSQDPNSHDIRRGPSVRTTTLGWQPTCECVSRDPVPATVFDPFAGSGTTLQVARALGRSGVGLDLSAEYLQLARKRLSLDALDAWTEGGKKDGKPIEDLPLFERIEYD